MMSDALFIALRRLTLLSKRLPGAVLFLEPFRKYFSNNKRTVHVLDFDGSLKLDLRLDEHMQSQIFWYGYYSRDIVIVLDHILKLGMVVVDAGANIGEITLASARRVGPTGRVYAFEPVRMLHSQLAKHLSDNLFSQAMAVQKGLSDSEETANIFTSSNRFRDGTENSGLASLFMSADRSAIADAIELTTLDSFMEQARPARLDLVKIDVEGAELAVLRGAEKTIVREQPYLIIEVQSSTAKSAGYEAADILHFLAPMGYSFYTIGRKARLQPLTVERLAQFQNVLCVPSSRSI